MRYRYESYHLVLLEWDVALAWAILEHSGRQVDGVVSVEKLAKNLGMHYIDEKLLDSDTIDTSIPVLVGTFRYPALGDAFVLDGHHRIAKAQRQGIQELPVYHFTREETARLERSCHMVEHNEYAATHACGAKVTIREEIAKDAGTWLKSTTQWFIQRISTNYTHDNTDQPNPGIADFWIPVTKCLQCSEDLSMAPHPSERQVELVKDEAINDWLYVD